MNNCKRENPVHMTVTNVYMVYMLVTDIGVTVIPVTVIPVTVV